MKNKIFQQPARNFTLVLFVSIAIGILTTVAGLGSAIFFSFDVKGYGDNSNLLIVGTAYVAEFMAKVIMIIVPIVEFALAFILLSIAMLFQLGKIRKWKIITGKVIVAIVEIIKIAFVVFLVDIVINISEISITTIIILQQIALCITQIILAVYLIYRHNSILNGK